MSSSQRPGTVCYAAAEVTWALVLAAECQIPQQMAALRSGRWQIGVGRTLRGQTLGIYGHGRIGAVVAGYAEAFGMKVAIWGREASRVRAQADGRQVPDSRAEFLGPDQLRQPEHPAGRARARVTIGL